MSTQPKNRSLQRTLAGMPTSDGAGVKLTRIVGTPELDYLDPFLMLDCFESDDADDYIGGFPTHPHRGFETVTYLLNGRMRHKDNAGNEGVIEPGGVQWMTAGRGILHSEMPEQENGMMKGFLLWVNLPASAKMTEPGYQEFPPENTPLETRENGTTIRVISGTTDEGTRGPVENNWTRPTYMDVTLPAGVTFTQKLESSHNAFVYVIEGELQLEGELSSTVAEKSLGILSHGEQVLTQAGQDGARFLLIAGQPMNEPIARGGPFVMNTKAEVLQAFADFNAGKF